jgi:2-keto-3-deoxy-L-rhamnonate aldolase RhmA
LDEVERIAAVDGIDIIFPGMDDLKLSFGLPLDSAIATTEPLAAARRKIAVAARNADKWAGCGIVDPAHLLSWAGLGYQLVAIASDVGFLRTGARKALEGARSSLTKSESLVET